MLTVPTPTDAPPDSEAVLRTLRACLHAVDHMVEAARLLAEFQELNGAWVTPAYRADDDSTPATADAYSETWGFDLLGSTLQATSELLAAPWDLPDPDPAHPGDYAAQVLRLLGAGHPFAAAFQEAISDQAQRSGGSL